MDGVARPAARILRSIVSSRSRACPVPPCRSKREGGDGDGVSGNHLVLRPALRSVPVSSNPFPVAYLVSSLVPPCVSPSVSSYPVFVFPDVPLSPHDRRLVLLVRRFAQLILPFSPCLVVRVFLIASSSHRLTIG